MNETLKILLISVGSMAIGVGLVMWYQHKDDDAEQETTNTIVYWPNVGEVSTNFLNPVRYAL